MWALEHSWAPRRDPVLADTPLALIATLGGIWLAAAWLAAGGWVPHALTRAVALAVVHGGLLAVALAWSRADSGVPLPRGAVEIAILLIGVGAMATALDSRGAFLLAGTPAWLAILASRGALTALGLHPRIPGRPALVGALVGALLGGHLLFSASQTLGYPLRREGWITLFVLWAYDLGANVISAECFFRGALFNRLQRRWSLGPAAAVATACALVRYLGDPLLPGEVEVMVGALFYVTMLGLVNCWLFWWSGSLVPGLLAAAVFFLVYRALAIG